MQEKINKLIVGDANWAGTIPDWLLEEIKAERMILGLGSMIKPECEKVGDAEVVAYLMTASLRAPMDHEYSEIYIWLAAKMMKKRGKELLDFMKEKLERGLQGDEERQLRELRQMIYDKRGGEINHPVLNLMRELKKGAERENKRLKETGQAKLF